MTNETARGTGPKGQHPLKTQSIETRKALESMLGDEIRRLTAQADVCIFALYDAECPNEGPIDFTTKERDAKLGTLNFTVDFDFEGIGVWYICCRFGDTYRLRHILVQVHRGRFIKGQVESFEGFWDEFPRFVSEDRWIKGMMPMPPQLPKLVENALGA
jgi:hypothetical protein